MKQRIQFVITAILLSAGTVSVPCSNGSVGAVEEDEIRQLVDNRLRQHSAKTLRHFTRWSTDGYPRAYATTTNRGKHPALLWHRFSLTPHPEFIHWIMPMWGHHTTFIPRRV